MIATVEQARLNLLTRTAQQAGAHEPQWKGAVSDLRERVLELVLTRGYEQRDEPFQLASGELSHDYIDGKRSIAAGADLREVTAAVLEKVEQEFDCVGGLTMGADPLAHAVAYAAPCNWFSVRKEPKGRGLNRYIEGARLDEASRVLIVEDVVTTGGSVLSAYDRVRQTGAEVVAALCLVDRGALARPKFEARGVPYYSLLTYHDLKIEPC